MASSLVKVEGLLGMLIIKVSDNNYTKWFFLFKPALEGYKLFGHFDGSVVCPPRVVLNIETSVTKEITTAYQE